MVSALCWRATRTFTSTEAPAGSSGAPSSNSSRMVAAPGRRVKLRRLAPVAAAALALLVVGVFAVGALQRPDTSLPPGTRGGFATVDGIRLRYVQAGQGRDVLLIHGSPGSLEDWDPVFDRLAARFRVTAFDRPGHGYSEGSRRPHTVTGNARISLGLIHALGLRDVLVVGHSYGGATALGMAVAAPPELRALVVVGSRVYPPVPVEPAVRALAVPHLGPGLAVLPVKLIDGVIQVALDTAADEEL